MANKAKKLEKQLEKQYKGIKKSKAATGANVAYNSMRRTVMARAWKIAKAGSEKYGGNASDYIQTAMKMAWAQNKNIYTPLKTIGGQVDAPSEKDMEEQFGEKAKAVREGYVYMSQVLKSLEEYTKEYGQDAPWASEGGKEKVKKSAQQLLEMINKAIDDEEKRNGGDEYEAYATIYQKIKNSIGISQFEEDMGHLIQATYDDLYATWALGDGAFSAYGEKVAEIASMLGTSFFVDFN